MSKLPKAPLQEVILEIRWGNHDPMFNVPLDPDFELAVGKFHNAVSSRFPMIKKKFPEEIPSMVIGNQPVYQFWTAENTWPVLQLGRGILTINETEANYTWSAFFETVKSAIADVCTAYSNQLKFSSFALRYIDVINIAEYDFKTWETFTNKHFNFNFNNDFIVDGELRAFSFNQSFELAGGAFLQLLFSSGLNNKNESVFVFQTTVNRNLEASEEVLIENIDSAHNYASDIFKKICKPELYASFN